MNYKMSRNGEEFGPYTLNEINYHLWEGNIQSSDFVFDGSRWISVSQFLKSPKKKTIITDDIKFESDQLRDSTNDKNNTLSSDLKNTFDENSNVLDDSEESWGISFLKGLTSLWPVFFGMFIYGITGSETTMLVFVGLAVIVGLIINRTPMGKKGWFNIGNGSAWSD